MFEELLRDAARVQHQHDTPPVSPPVIENEVAARRERIQAMLDRLTPEQRHRSDAALADLSKTFDPLEWLKTVNRAEAD